MNAAPNNEPVCLGIDTPKPERPVSLLYKLATTALSVSSVAFVAQNLDTLHQWERARTDNYYPAPPEVCEPYVDMQRDLTTALPMPNTAVSSPVEAKKLLAQGKNIVFVPNVSLKRSLAEKFDPGGIKPLTTLEQARTFFDHKIQTIPTTFGMDIHIYSSTESPSLTIDSARFNQLFTAVLDPNLTMGDQHYNELLTCLRAANLPQKRSSTSFDIFILPEPNYCIDNLRYFRVPENASYDCVANGGTPPRLKLDFLFWTPLDEEFMLLSTDIEPNEGNTDANRYITRMLAHESVHFWLNQLFTTTELGPQERFVDAVVQTMTVMNIADINNTNRPAIRYRD